VAGLALIKESRIMNELEFGDYVTIEQKRFGVDNEMYLHKVIGVFSSNAYVAVPVQIPDEEKIHEGGCVPVVACICCGVQETEVRKYRLKDVKMAPSQLQKAKDLIHHAADENERLKAELESAILLLKKSTGFVCRSLLQEPIQDFIKRNTPLPEPKKSKLRPGTNLPECKWQRNACNVIYCTDTGCKLFDQPCSKRCDCPEPKKAKPAPKNPVSRLPLKLYPITGE
jgi:hypothetical protein